MKGSVDQDSLECIEKLELPQNIKSIIGKSYEASKYNIGVQQGYMLSPLHLKQPK